MKYIIIGIILLGVLFLFALFMLIMTYWIAFQLKEMMNNKK